MPENPFEWAMFSFFVIGSFGGWLWIAVLLLRRYYDWRHERLSKQTKEVEDWNIEDYYPKHASQQAFTKLTGRIK